MKTLTNHNNSVEIPTLEEEIDECEDYTQEDFLNSLSSDVLQYDEETDDLW